MGSNIFDARHAVSSIIILLRKRTLSILTPRLLSLQFIPSWLVWWKYSRRIYILAINYAIPWTRSQFFSRFKPLDVWCELALQSLNSYGVQAHMHTFTTRIKLLDDYIPAVISRRLRERIKNNFRLTLTFGKRLFPLRIADETHVPWYTSSCFSISLNN